MKRAVFIGRFQPFHRGHYNAVEAADSAFALTIAVGSAQQARTLQNPLTYGERNAVIRSCFPDVPIIGVPDHDHDADWFAYLQEFIDFDIGISGNDHVQRIFQDHDVPILDPDYLEPDTFSGTHIREQIVAEAEWRELVAPCALEVLDELGFPEIVRSAQKQSE